MLGDTHYPTQQSWRDQRGERGHAWTRYKLSRCCRSLPRGTSASRQLITRTQLLQVSCLIVSCFDRRSAPFSEFCSEDFFSATLSCRLNSWYGSHGALVDRSAFPAIQTEENINNVITKHDVVQMKGQGDRKIGTLSREGGGGSRGLGKKLWGLQVTNLLPR